MANTQRNVDIAIRARDETQRVLARAKAGMESFYQAANRTARYRGLVDNQKQTAAAAREAAVELKKVGLAASGEQVRGFKAARDAARAAKAEVASYKQELSKLSRKTGGPVAGFGQFESLIKARTDADRAAVAVDRLGDALARVAAQEQRKSRFAAFDAVARGDSPTSVDTQERIAEVQKRAASATLQHASAAVQLESALAQEARLAREVDGAQAALWAEQRKGSASTEELTRAKVRLADAQQRLAMASRQVIALQRLETASGARTGDLAQRTANAYGSRNGRGPLGLRPYELTNLGYQVNDLITQISSGTSPMQAIAQQGGQIIQIFPRAATAILRMVPAIAAVTAIVAPFIGAFGRLNSVTSNIRQFDAELTASADSASYTAEELASAARQLDDLGASGDEARKMIQQFVKDGLNPTYIRDFGEAARDLAKITGQDLVDANKLLSEGLTGSYEDFRQLDQALNVATVAERRRIRELYESGKAEEARRMAAEITFRKLDDGAKKLEGPWSRAARNFGRAWTNLLENVGNWPIVQGAISLIDRLGRKLEWLTRLMAGGTETEAEGRAIARGRGRMNQIDQQLANIDSALTRDAPSTWTPQRIEREGRRLTQQRDALLRERVSVGTDVATRENALRTQATGDTRLDNNRNQKEDEDRALAQGSRAGAGSASDAERRAEAQRDFVAGLLAENAAREFQISLIDQSERQQRILTAIREAELGAQQVGLELTAEQRAEIERTTGALYDAEQAHKAAETIERARLDLARQRGEIEERNAFIARKLAEDTQGWALQQKVAYAKLLAAQYDVEAGARRRAAAEKAVSDQMALRESLLESISYYEEQGDQGRVADLKTQLEDVNAELLTAIDNLLAFWSTFDTPEALTAIENLNRTRNLVAGTGQTAIVTGKQINDSIAQGGAQAFDRFAQQLVETGNVFRSLRDAFLQFAADFLRQIAQMIIQQLILNAISGMLGGGGAGGGVGATIAGPINALVRHDGGGTSGGPYRSVPLSAFAGARRYHVGGVAGFAPGEIPAILREGEVVDPGDGSVFSKVFGGAGGGKQPFKIVNAFSASDLLDKALGSDEGERIFMNYIRSNAGAIRGVLG